MIEKLDSQSRNMLSYLNSHHELSSSTLAEVFNQHYKANLENALLTLMFLKNHGFVEARTKDNSSALMIQITHTGRTYEQTLHEENVDRKRKILHDRIWNIITLVLSAIISILTNIFMDLFRG